MKIHYFPFENSLLSLQNIQKCCPNHFFLVANTEAGIVKLKWFSFFQKKCVFLFAMDNMHPKH